jgi:glycosyltransferase involved in cell wall biosynthesis
MLPPALYPQAIQIGRLLAHFDGDIGAVCGSFGTRADLDHDFGLGARLAFRLEVAFKPKLSGLAFSLARRLIPFYASSPDEFRAWVPLAEAAVCDKLQQSRFVPDAVVTFGEPMSDHLLGLRLKRKFKLPWTAHFSDPWSDSPFRRHDVLIDVVNRRLERRVVAAADRLIFTSPETVDLVMCKYPVAWRQKCSVLPHSFDPKLYPASPPPPRPTLMVRYLGNFHGHRTPLPLFHALHSILRDQSDALRDVNFELVGRVPAWVRWHRAFRSLPDKLVRLVPTVPYSESLKLMVESDLLMVIDGPDDLSVFLPSKLIEYIGAGVPICGIVPPGTSAKILRRLGGSFADPRDTGQIAKMLVRALRLARERRADATLSHWGDADFRASFTIERVAKEFRATLTGVASTSPQTWQGYG